MSCASLSFKLVGAQFSLFTGKLRAYLDWKKIPYRTVIATDAVYKHLIKPSSFVPSIPILLILHHDDNGEIVRTETIQDTKLIIDYFEEGPGKSQTVGYTDDGLVHPVVPTSYRRAFVAMLLELLADEWLLMQAMYFRWGVGDAYKKDEFAAQRKFLEFEFGNNATGGNSSCIALDSPSYDKTCEIGRRRLSAFASSLPGLGITTATAPMLRQNFHELLRQLSAHLERNLFLLGANITIADFAFYGSFYAHLGRDPIPSSIIKVEAPLVFEWIERVGGLGRGGGLRVERLIQIDGGSGWKLLQDYDKRVVNQADDVADTLADVVKPLIVGYIPVLLDVITHTIDFLESSEAAKGEELPIPRTLGTHEFWLSNEVKENRLIWTHGLWIFQRIIDKTYNTSAKQETADAWLKGISANNILDQWRKAVNLWSNSGWVISRSVRGRLYGVNSAGRASARL